MARSDGYNPKTRQLILDYLIRTRPPAVSASNILKCVRCGRIYHLDCHFMDEVRAHLMAEHGFTLQCEGSVLYGLCRSCAANEAEDGQAAQTCKNCCADVDTDKKQ